MATDAELRDQAVALLAKTTITYPAWVKGGRSKSSNWTKALALLTQIGPASGPDAPVGPFTDATAPQWFRNTASPSTVKGIHVHDTPDYGFGLMGYFNEPGNPGGVPLPSPSAFTVSDIWAERVGSSPPKMGGTGEAAIWLGAQVNAERLRAAGGTWMGMWVGCQARDSVISDFVCAQQAPDGTYTAPLPHVGLYVEHFTRRTTFRNFFIAGGDSNSVNIEWWYRDPAYASYVAAEYGAKCPAGLAGSCELTFDGGTIWCPATANGVFADAGTWGCTFRNITFVGPGNAICLPKNLAGPVDNVVDIASCLFENAGSKVTYHQNAIGA